VTLTAQRGPQAFGTAAATTRLLCPPTTRIILLGLGVRPTNSLRRSGSSGASRPTRTNGSRSSSRTRETKKSNRDDPKHRQQHPQHGWARMSEEVTTTKVLLVLEQSQTMRILLVQLRWLLRLSFRCCHRRHRHPTASLIIRCRFAT